MQKTQQKKKSKHKKLKTKIVLSRLIASSEKKRWVTRKKTFSPYPYIITISYYKRNLFFTVADIQGQTKAWISTGRGGMKSKDKTTYMAIVKIAELFFKKVWSLGIRRVILRLKNLYQRGTRFAIRNSLKKIRHRYPLRYIGILAETQVAFNGCRKKKVRHK